MASRDIIVYDFETTGKNPNTCQPTQLAALALDGRNFRLKGTFNSEIKPLYFDEEEAVENGWGAIEQGALDITGKTLAELQKAPTLDSVWPKFVKFVNKYNWKGTPWFAPIPCGYNINNYDSIIIKKLCKMYGPWDEKYSTQALFHPIQKFDVMDDMFGWTESDPTIKSISMDNVRKRMGMSDEGAHDALQDVKDTANILIKFQKTKREIYKKLKIDDCFANGGLYIE